MRTCEVFCASCGDPSYVLVESSLTLFDPLPPFLSEHICTLCLLMIMKAVHHSSGLNPPKLRLTVSEPFVINCAQYEATT